MLINSETIDNLEILSRLRLSEDEKTRVKGDLSNILTYMDVLNELDTADYEPLVHFENIQNILRDDIVSDSADRDALLQNTQSKKDGQFLTPNTIS